LICFFPIVVALADGLRSADPELLKLYRTFGAGQLRLFWLVKLPGALPALFSGIRIAVTYSIIGAIFAEYVGSSEGLGFFLQLEQHAFATAAEMATILVMALLSISLFLLVAVIERQALPWYYTGGRQSSL
jgi:ABC-type nitrate/sulfonate/bicarbonate transport system permease component